MMKPKRLLQEFLRKAPQEYYLHEFDDSNFFVQLNVYSSFVNKIALRGYPEIMQCRDIVFCGPDYTIKAFIKELEQYGYKENKEIFIAQLRLENKMHLLKNPEELKDWLVGDDDIMF